ncbi:hypothetical protein ACS0TY_015223 [Phlomoides rotata]
MATKDNLEKRGLVACEGLHSPTPVDEVVVQATYGVVVGIITLIRAFMLSMNVYIRMCRRRGHFNRQQCDLRDRLRMNIDCFNRLCFFLENIGGLSPTHNVIIVEQVAIFLFVLSHHTKNRIMKYSFKRSGTVSKHFNFVLNTLLKLHTILLINPQPVHDDCTDNRWKYLKGCLGALDGTYIPVKVLAIDIPRYRNQKGFVSVNVLAVCDRNMSYIYVLSGWEGSSVDSRVLCDAVTREHGLKVTIIWLMVGTQTEMVPYRGFKYHLREWDNTHYAPHNYQEPFNIKHSKAPRWGILMSNSYYPIKTQNHIILGCCLLHNFIRTHTEVDPMENDVLEFDNEVDGENTPVEDFIDAVEPSQAWTSWRDNLAMQIKLISHRRVWTYDKENVLVNSLKELVARDYKCDNGF